MFCDKLTLSHRVIDQPTIPPAVLERSTKGKTVSSKSWGSSFHLATASALRPVLPQEKVNSYLLSLKAVMRSLWEEIDLSLKSNQNVSTAPNLLRSKRTRED